MAAHLAGNQVSAASRGGYEMKCCQRIVLALALLSFASVQTGCVEMPTRIKVSSNYRPRNPPDPARLARCSHIEVAIAGSSSAVFYGEFSGPDDIHGFVLREDEIDRASLGRIRDHVGQDFADHLQRAFPEKKVSYNSTSLDSSVPRKVGPGQDEDRSAICLLSYTYIIHIPREKVRRFKPIWVGPYRVLPSEVVVIEPSPPLFLPREQVYVSGGGWATDRAFWSAGFERGSAHPITPHPEYPLGRVAEVEVWDEARGVFRPKSVRLDYERLERAMLEWAKHRASGVARQLRDVLAQTAHGG